MPMPVSFGQAKNYSDNKLMPQPGEPFQPQPAAEDAFLDLLLESLEGLNELARGQFLRQFFRTVAQIDLSESQSNEYWHRVLARRRELSGGQGTRIKLQTAMLDVLASANLLRVPVFVEYEEFKKLQINAATDALTGLYNRRLFDEYCDKELNRATRYGQHLAIVIFDLHKLKEVNDVHGHLQGDHVLRLAANTLRTTLRASDFAFRIGGDEFALLLPQTDPDQAVTLCRRVRAQYENELNPLHLGIDMTLDFGVAVHPRDGDQKSTLLSIADQRLYELKHAARVPPRAIPLETPASRETASAPPPSSVGRVPSSVPPANAPSTAGPAATGEQRKWERVSLAGTKAHAVLTGLEQKTAGVIDLSYGGVALLFERHEDLPEQFHAVLHVPILPPVRVALRRTYAIRTGADRTRVGCAFVS